MVGVCGLSSLVDDCSASRTGVAGVEVVVLFPEAEPAAPAAEPLERLPPLDAEFLPLPMSWGEEVVFCFVLGRGTVARFGWLMFCVLCAGAGVERDNMKPAR